MPARPASGALAPLPASPGGRGYRLASRAQAPSSVIRDLLALVERPGVLSLAGGLPPAEVLGDDDLADAVRRAAHRTGPYGPVGLQYGPTEGLEALRAWVATRLAAPGEDLDATRVLVTTGSQQALALVAGALVEPGDPVVVPEPCYPGALGALRWAGARPVAVPGDEGGLDTAGLERRLRAGLRPALVVVVSTHANPTGATLTAERRRHLGELAERYGFVVVDDNPYADLGFPGAPPPPPPVRASTERIVSLGSASKTVAPGLRLGWLAAPPDLVAPLVVAKQAADLHTSTLAQEALLGLVGRPGWFDARLGAVRALLAERAAALAGGLAEHAADHLDLGDAVTGGMFLWPRLRPGRRWAGADDLFHAALAAGVAFVPGPAFGVAAPPRTGSAPAGRPGPLVDRLRLSFASLPPAQLREAARRLGDVLAGAGTPG